MPPAHPGQALTGCDLSKTQSLSGFIQTPRRSRGAPLESAAVNSGFSEKTKLQPPSASAQATINMTRMV
jgi:hypothetical protein